MYYETTLLKKVTEVEAEYFKKKERERAAGVAMPLTYYKALIQLQLIHDVAKEASSEMTRLKAETHEALSRITAP